MHDSARVHWTMVMMLALMGGAPVRVTGQEGDSRGQPSKTTKAPKPSEEVKKAEPAHVEAKPPPNEIEKGQEHLTQQRWQKAFEKFDTAIHQAPDDPPGYWFHALAARRLGRRAVALADYDHLIRLVPANADSPQANWRAYALLELGRGADALDALNAVIARRPNDQEAILLRGQAYESLDQLQKAADDYAALVKRSPKSAAAMLRLGNVLVRLGRHANGLDYQKRALRLAGLEEGELIYQDSMSKVFFRFVFVPPGPRWIGYDERQRVNAAAAARQVLFGHNATPLREVRLQKGFFILDREITEAQCAALESARIDKGRRTEKRPAAGLPNEKEIAPPPVVGKPVSNERPRTDVTWNEAVGCCQIMQERIGLPVRLPTEIEWECAARSQRQWLYPWEGDENHAWCEKGEQPDAGPRALDQSQSLDVTPSGIFDMAGNVSEWCLDDYRNSVLEESSTPLAYSPAAPPKLVRSAKPPSRNKPRPVPEPMAKPLPPANLEAVRKTYRGGSYRDTRFNCHTPVRRAMSAGERTPAIGFRPILLLEFPK